MADVPQHPSARADVPDPAVLLDNLRTFIDEVRKGWFKAFRSAAEDFSVISRALMDECKKVKAFKDEFEDLGYEFEDLEHLFNNLKDLFIKLKNTLQKLETRSRGLKHLSKDLRLLFKKYKHKFNEFMDDFEELEDGLDDLKDDYDDLKDDFDDVKDEFAELEDQFDTLKDEYNQVKERHDVKQLEDAFLEAKEKEFSEVKQLEDQVKESLRLLEAEARRTHAFLRNSILENPTLPIHPLVVYRPGQGVLEPDSRHFPRSAKEFFDLKHPQSPRQLAMLRYLQSFYVVRLPLAPESSDDEPTVPLPPAPESSSEPTVPSPPAPESFSEEPAAPRLLVKALGYILGLDEERFHRFAQRAEERSRSPSRPAKRPLLPVEEDEPDTQHREHKRRLKFHRDLRQSPPTMSYDGLPTMSYAVSRPCPTTVSLPSMSDSHHKNSRHGTARRDAQGWASASFPLVPARTREP